MIKLRIIIASTRPERKGPAVGSWIYEMAAKRWGTETKVFDLADINLPFLDEPKHPRFKDYTKEHTKKWSAMIEEADAFIIVTPEYNYGYPAPLKNALDFLYQEWNNKPVAFVSYGGIAGGTRAVQQLKQIVTAQKMMPVLEAVHIPFFTKYIDESGKFNGDQTMARSAEDMLTALIRWANILSRVRQDESSGTAA
jgi:NAD(P)H-dependent FMN reductase